MIRLLIKKDVIWPFLIGLVSLLMYLLSFSINIQDSGTIKYLGFLVFDLIIIFLAFSANSYFNAFLFLFPIVIYYMPGLFLLTKIDVDYVSALGWLLSFSICAFWLGYQISYSDKSIFIYNSESNIKLETLFAVLITVAILSTFSGAIIGMENKILKGFGFLIKDVSLYLLFGFALVLASRTFFLFNIFVAFYFFILLLSFHYLVDVSRFGIVRICVLYLFGILINKHGNFKPISMASIGFVISILVVVLLGGGELDTKKFGGDALILNNAREVIKEYSENSALPHEPVMPIFNAGLFIIPDKLWVTNEKPKLYNASSWYLKNVKNIDPGDYPWGIGLGGVGSAFIYGGSLSIFVIYLCTGMIFGFMRNRIRTVFQAGVFASMLISLPFGLYRMDETFLFGVGLIVIPYIIYLFRRPAVKIAGRC